LVIFKLDSYFLFKLKGYFLYFTPIVHSMPKLIIHFRLVLIILLIHLLTHMLLFSSHLAMLAIKACEIETGRGGWNDQFVSDLRKKYLIVLEYSSFLLHNFVFIIIELQWQYIFIRRSQMDIFPLF